MAEQRILLSDVRRAIGMMLLQMLWPNLAYLVVSSPGKYSNESFSMSESSPPEVYGRTASHFPRRSWSTKMVPSADWVAAGCNKGPKMSSHC